MKFRLGLSCALALVLLARCHGSSPTEPACGDATGTWTGTITDPCTGTFSGPVVISVTNTTTLTMAGFLGVTATGTISCNTATFTYPTTTGACPTSGGGSFTLSGNTITGNLTANATAGTRCCPAGTFSSVAFTLAR